MADLPIAAPDPVTIERIARNMASPSRINMVHPSTYAFAGRQILSALGYRTNDVVLDPGLEKRFQTRYETPPVPESEAEWAIFWAFYQLTVDQRDRAWRQIEDLKRDLEKVDAGG